MNFDRSTEGESPLRWLNVIQRGGTDDWRRLYRRCRDREFAHEIATLLGRPDPDSLPASRLWLRLLEDLHPGLPSDDQPGGSSPAVDDGKMIVGSEDGSVCCFGGKR
jgi:hypothetical protein